MTQITARQASKRSTEDLEIMLYDPAMPDDVQAVIEDELERRAYDASDPWSPQNHHD
jgi:hypothetical protein